MKHLVKSGSHLPSGLSLALCLSWAFIVKSREWEVENVLTLGVSLWLELCLTNPLTFFL